MIILNSLDTDSREEADDKIIVYYQITAKLHNC